MSKSATWIIIVLAVLGVAFAAVSAAASREAVQIVREIRKEPTIMATITTTWKDANGIDHSVTTTKGPDESDESHALRHKAAVDAMLKLYPKG